MIGTNIQDGLYEGYTNGVLTSKYGMRDGYYYGSCMCVYKGIIMVEEYNKIGYWDGTYRRYFSKGMDVTEYIGNGFDMYMMEAVNGYESYWVGNIGLCIFHYYDGKVSYREKNMNEVVRYYKNGYMKCMYKSKKFMLL